MSEWAVVDVALEPTVSGAHAEGLTADGQLTVRFDVAFNVEIALADGDVWRGTSLEPDEVSEWLRLLSGEPCL